METSDRGKSIFIFMRPRGTYNSDSREVTLPEQSRGREEDEVSLYDLAGWGVHFTLRQMRGQGKRFNIYTFRNRSGPQGGVCVERW